MSTMRGSEMDVEVVWRSTVGDAPGTSIIPFAETRVTTASPESVDTVVRTIASSGGVNRLVESSPARKTVFTCASRTCSLRQARSRFEVLAPARPYAYYALSGDEVALLAGTAIAELWYAEPFVALPYRAGRIRGPDRLWTERLLGTTFEGGERIEIRVPRGFQSAYQIVTGGQRRALPIGSTWDAAVGTLFWQAAPGFLGRFTSCR